MMMTNSIKPLHTENVLDPRLEAMKYGQDKIKWGIFKGCQNQNWVQQQANSYSTAGITWNFNTQSERSLIDRRVYAKVQFKITFTGTAPIGQPLLSDEQDAPRAFPLGAITQSLKVTVNGTSFEGQYADDLECMLRFNTDFDLKNYDLSQTPTMLDTYQLYDDAVGGSRNPLGTYNNGSYEQGRGSFYLDSLVNPLSVNPAVAIQAVATFTVVEPLLLSPMLYSCTDLQSGLIGVKNMGAQFSFKAGQLSRIWSHNPDTAGVTISNVNVEIGPGATTPPQLLINYLNPPLLDSIGEVPPAPVYQYYKTDTYINDFNTTLAPGASQTFNNNAIQLSTVPQSIYIWFTRPNNDKDYTTTDTAFKINSLSVNYLNVAGQFSTMTDHDLYVMSVKNGLKSSWIEFAGSTQDVSTGTAYGLTGSFLKLSVEDLAVPDNMASGVNVNSQLSITCNITNVNRSETLGVQCNVMLVYDGLATIVNGNAISQVGIITEQDVVETRATKTWVDFNKAQRMYGGSMWSKLGSLAKNLLTPENINKGISAAKNIHSLVKSAQGGALMGGELVGEGRRKKGGARMSADELRERLLY